MANLQIKDMPLKTSINGNEDILIQDSGVTKRIKTDLLMDSVDMSGYYTKEEIDNLIDDIPSGGSGSVDLTDVNKRLDEIETIANASFDSCSDVFVELEVTLLDTWISTAGNSSTYNSWKHVEIPNIHAGEKYRFCCSAGGGLRVYVIKNNAGAVTRYYKEDPYDTQHVYDVEVTIAENEEGGTLYVNTIRNNLIGVKRNDAFRVDAEKLINGDYFMKNNLWGKSVIFYGDSIAASANSWAGANTLRARFNLSGVSYAVGGMTFTTDDSSNESNNIYKAITQPTSVASLATADYVCLQGGTNDILKSLTIGDAFSDTDYTSELDTTTFSGAFEASCRALYEYAPQAKKLYISPLYLGKTNENAYKDIAKKICNKYSIKYLDLSSEGGLNYKIPGINDTYFNSADGIHPNKAGYDLHINDKVAFALNSL